VPYHAASRLVLQAKIFAVFVYSVDNICTVKAAMPLVKLHHDVLAFTMIVLQ
jgi:hypothetical protein